MANEEHVKILKQGVDVWNKWREENPDIEPDFDESEFRGMNLNRVNFNRAFLRNTDLTGTELRMACIAQADLSNSTLDEADLSVADLNRSKLRNTSLNKAILSKATILEADLTDSIIYKADLERANMRKTIFAESFLAESNLIRADLAETSLYNANLSQVNLYNASLTGSDLRNVNLSSAHLVEADFRKSNLTGADLSYANMLRTNLSGANLHGSNLIGAQLVETDLRNANLTGCAIYGISAWGLKVKAARQLDLVITPNGDPFITVDNLEVAQFIYLLLHNEKIRHVIDTITSKVVLILGRFTKPRKAVLDAIRNELRQHDYIPVLFDFEKPSSRNLTETISTLAHMARFVIADLTDAKSIPQELQRIVPDLPSLPVQPVILSSQYEYAMFKDFLDYQSVLIPHRYADLDNLLATLHEKVINPAIDKAEEIQQRRNVIEQQLANR